MIRGGPRRTVLPAFLFLLLTLSGVARASIVHFVGPGDSVTSLALEYYGEANRAMVLRAANNWPLEGEVELALGEPVVIPECTRRVVGEGQTWEDLARDELGSAERAWLVAEANQANPQVPPEVGQIVTIPFLLPMVLQDGVTAAMRRFYSDRSRSGRHEAERLVKRLHQVTCLMGEMSQSCFKIRTQSGWAYSLSKSSITTGQLR